MTTTSYEAYQKAQQRIAKAKRTAASVLDLRYLKLTEVPKELGQLANLTTLNLNHNQLTEVPKELGQLANLTTLNLNHNQLTEVPKELRQLANLTRLDPGLFHSKNVNQYV